MGGLSRILPTPASLASPNSLLYRWKKQGWQSLGVKTLGLLFPALVLVEVLDCRAVVEPFFKVCKTGEPGGLPSTGWHRVGHD